MGFPIHVLCYAKRKKAIVIFATDQGMQLGTVNIFHFL